MNKVVVICSPAVSSKRSGDESDEGHTSGPRRRKRRSRWAPENEKFGGMPGSTATETGGGCASMTVNLQPPVTNTLGVYKSDQSYRFKSLIPASVVSKL
jgi:hypothetical protein